GTSSGSYLVSHTPITASQSLAPPILEAPLALPEPDWSILNPATTNEYQSHLQLHSRVQELTANLHLTHSQILICEGIIESAHAQLIVQNLYVSKLQQSLQAKENKKKTDCVKLLPNGKGQHLTAKEFIWELKLAEQSRNAQVQQQARRKQDLAAKKQAKEASEAEWKGICQNHKLAVEAWKI
ncbi:hypothetical protein K439DRAFT_1331847, partial [Ramaria rubella]